ncbi:5319_t:CDS:2, partial [Acaulospora morrowiae]
GILLRRLESDKLLTDISHVIVDEVHERTLEIILMSATLEAQKFSQYFYNCPVVDIPGKTFPVTVKYLEDVIEETGYTIDEGDEYARKVFRQIRDEGTLSVTGRGNTT